jgi:hypothetical protein
MPHVVTRPVMHSGVYARNQEPPRHHYRKRWVLFSLAIILAAGAYFNLGTTNFGIAHADVTHNAIRSGLSGACMDVFHSGTKSGTVIDTASCNGSAAQDWVTTDTSIQQEKTNSCVAVNADGSIVLDDCSQVPGEVWLREQQGYFNPNTTKCLSAPGNGQQLRIASCNNLSSANEAWIPDSDAQAPACSGSQSQMVACEAVKQWQAWQAAGSNHESLLTTYTDGTPYEEWCADFVSYIYQQAGYPFTNGSADGWDENDANSVQYMGFTIHMVGSGYVPQTGDVAFFNYPGGHVEIVVSGGSNPSFVYGDSAQTDPTTGNGEMKSNTILQDDSSTPGQVEYYMTPNANT